MPMTNAEKQKKYRDRLKTKEGNLARTTEVNNLLNLSITEFFTKVTGLIPTAKQVEVLTALVDEQITNILISAGRQTGKSLCCSVAAIYLTLKSKKQICLVSAKENFIYAHLTEIFATNPDLRAYVSWEGTANIIPKTGYELKNGSKVLLLTSSEKGIRGASASILFLDEAELMPSETLSTVYGNLSGKKIKLVILGTASSRYSKFNELLKNPKKYNFTLYKWSELDCEWHTKEELESKRKLLTDDEWQRDVLGELSESDTKLLWDAELINRCIRETVLSEGKPREAGLDGGGFGLTNRDKLSLTIIERIGKFKEKVLLSKVWGLEEIANAYSEIGKLLKEYKVVLCKVDSLPVDTVERVKEVFDKSRVFSVNAKNYKEECQGQLTHIIEGQGLEIPAEYEDLIQEMKSYKKQGRPHYDDRVDSLLLATYSNDVLFPVKAPTSGRITICDMNKRTQWSNFGNSRSAPLTNTAYPNNRNFVPNTANKNRQPIYGREKTKAEKVYDSMGET